MNSERGKTAKIVRVRPGTGHTVAEVMACEGADAGAVAEGRVFVGRRRVRRGDEPLSEGQILEIRAARPMAKAVRVLMHEHDLVAVDKPAGMPTIADQTGAEHALVHVAAKTLGIDPGRLHPTSRLDRGVSGVVVFALTKGAAERLLRARAEGVYERRYVALAKRSPGSAAGTWDAPVGRAANPKLRMVNGRDPVAAVTRYFCSACATEGVALLGIAPRTGRTHQIRLHAAHAGAPLLGDRDYGGPTRIGLSTGRVLELRRVALHSARVVVPGAAGERVTILSAVPQELDELWCALGGDSSAWDLAASRSLES